jgi:hypothetical protein
MTGLKTAKVVVLVFSKNAQESVFVNNEIDTAFSNNKPIISFKIDETFPENKMEFFLKNKHWLDAYPNPESVFETLVRDTFLLCEDEPQTYVEPEKEVLETVKENTSELEEKLENNDEQIVDVVELDEYPKEEVEEEVPDNSTQVVSQDPDYSHAQTESGSTSSKLPIIAVIAVVLIAVVGFVVFSGGLGGDSSSSSDGGIVIDYVELDDDSDKGYSWKYSYFVMGTISPDLSNSSDSVVHTDYYGESGDIVKSNETKLQDINGNVLGMCFINKKVTKVSVELRDSSGNVISAAESEDIQ